MRRLGRGPAVDEAASIARASGVALAVRLTRNIGSAAPRCVRSLLVELPVSGASVSSFAERAGFTAFAQLAAESGDRQRYDRPARPDGEPGRDGRAARGRCRTRRVRE